MPKIASRGVVSWSYLVDEHSACRAVACIVVVDGSPAIEAAVIDTDADD